MTPFIQCCPLCSIYISGSFSQSQCRWSAIRKECFIVFMSIKSVHFTYKVPTYLYIQTGHTDNDKCNMLLCVAVLCGFLRLSRGIGSHIL